jgi:5-methyltetrahydropteroyltriglutamate--homocysteine methyltransferase
LPALFRIRAGRFYVQLASEQNPESVLKMIGEHRQSDQTIFVGVTDPIDPTIETAEQIRDRVLLAATYIPLPHLGTTDDCGFSPFADDASTSREIAFEKIRARIVGTALAADRLRRPATTGKAGGS